MSDNSLLSLTSPLQEEGKKNFDLSKKVKSGVDLSLLNKDKLLKHTESSLEFILVSIC